VFVLLALIRVKEAFFGALLVCSFGMCAGIPTIEMNTCFLHSNNDFPNKQTLASFGFYDSKYVWTFAV
jgi:hypothetical protein